MSVGIPRALYYHKYGPLWQTFFEELGEEIVFSAQTDRAMLERGISATVAEICLPLKAWFGHALDVAHRADWLWAPRYMSVYRREYICPKFGGLPDMAAATLPGVRLLSPQINRHDRADGGLRAAVETARALGHGSRQARAAYERAVAAYLAHRAAQVQPAARPDGRPTVLLLGHPYLLGDGFLSMDVVGKLRRLGVAVRTLESFDAHALRAAAEMEKPLFYTWGIHALGSAALLRQHGVAGVVYATCFGCGVDSFVAYLLQRRLREQGLPLTLLTLDEHTAQAGVDTRLEAFADTLGRRLTEAAR